MRDPQVRAAEAAQALESPVLTEAFNAVEREFIEKAISAEADNDAAMIENIRHVRALRAVRAALNSFVTTGKMKAQKGINNVA